MKVYQKHLRTAGAAVLLFLVSTGSGGAAVDVLGGSLTQATPYDQRISAAGVLSMASEPILSRLRSSNDLFFQARSMRYTADPAGQDYWQTPEETQARWSGDCEDKALWLFAELKKNGHSQVRLVVGRQHSTGRNLHVWVTMADDENNIWILDPTAQKKIWRSKDFGQGAYRPLYSFDGFNRYHHEAS